MRGPHDHQWTITTLQDDYVPGIPCYVTSCPCGALKPTEQAEVPAVA